MKFKYYIRISAFSIWLISLWWLVRYEAFPEYFTYVVRGYHSLLSKELLVRDLWYRIKFNDKPVGFSNTTIDINENTPTHYYQIRNKLQLKLNLMGETRDIDTSSEISLDILHNLTRFSFSLSSQDYTTRIMGYRRGENNFAVTIRTGRQVHHTTVNIPPDVVFYSPMTEFMLKNLKPGQHIIIKTLDPITMTVIPVRIRALRYEPVVYDRETIKASVLSLEYQGQTFFSWITEQGEVLKQETPFGWQIEKCKPHEAIVLAGDSADADLLNTMAVRCRGTIPFPRTCSFLKLKLSGVHFSIDELTTERQRVDTIEETNTVLISTSAKLPDTVNKPEQVNTKEALLSTPWIQSDAQEIVQKAQTIVGDATNHWDKAVRIMRWVHKSMRKTPTVSIPSAIEILHRLEGDCNEHAYLFTALTRSVGVPAKVIAGLTYHEGKFYYHAWVAIYIGSWVEMDPTLGQELVDATHILLASGEFVEQLRLVKTLRHLEIEVLECK